MTHDSFKMIAASVLVLPLCLSACEAEPGADDEFELDTDAEDQDQERASYLWEPQPDPNCAEPVSRPPTNGWCETEVSLFRSRFVTGQGISEGRGEISFVATATSAGLPATVASSPEQVYSVGERKGHNLKLGTYKVRSGFTRDVTVCVDFTEHDGGGLNGQDDTGTGCETLTLSCNPSIGQPTARATIGPVTLCGDNQCLGSTSARIQAIRTDADFDGIPNEFDFTPEPCDEANKGTKGIGLLIYYHYDDSPFVTLAQALGTNLAVHYDKYDFVALVADNATSNANNALGFAFRDANVVYEPSQDGLMSAMRELTSRGLRFDVFYHAHGYENELTDSKLEVLTGDKISGDWLIDATHPNKVGTAAGGIPIVATWGTACWGSRMMDAWDAIGALVGSGAYHINFLPMSWGNFWDNWVAGQRYGTAVNDSATSLVVTTAHGLVLTQGTAAPYFCLTAHGNDVLGNNACAENFFNDGLGLDLAQYDLEDIYDTSQTGAQNMATASARTFVGARATVFGGGAAVWP